MSQFTILRCTEGTSDKVWIARNSSTNGHYDCWYGPTSAARTGALTARTCKGDLYKKSREKYRKGYEDWSDMDFDEASGRVIAASASISEPDLTLPSRFWYRLDTRLHPIEKAQQLVVGISDSLFNHEDVDIQHFAQEFESLSVVEQILGGKEAGGSEYEEGVLGLFLVFALQRKLNAQVSDDSNAALPTRFADLEPYIHQCWHWEGLSIESDTAIVKELAMTFGCLDRPAGASLEQRRKIARSVSF